MATLTDTIVHTGVTTIRMWFWKRKSISLEWLFGLRCRAMGLSVHSSLIRRSLDNFPSTCSKPSFFLKFNTKETFASSKMELRPTMRRPTVFVNGLTAILVTGGLEGEDQTISHHVHPIYRRWTFSYGLFSRTWSTKRNRERSLIYVVLLLKSSPQSTWNCAEKFVVVSLRVCSLVSKIMENNSNNFVSSHHCCIIVNLFKSS